ncbi:class I SAM-dependent methyltransferase [bacterium]|nr:class I SAM-dependent methyltransferase [bacterium]
MSRENQERETWDHAFEEASRRKAFNLAPAEPLVRSVSYYLRSRFTDGEYHHLNFLEMGCGAGPNLRWLAGQGIRVHGVDISPVALKLCRSVLEDGMGSECVGELISGSVCDVPLENESMDGIIESNVFQHLDAAERQKAFHEVCRILKPGGIFVGYMLSSQHQVFQDRKKDELEEDPGTLILNDGGSAFQMNNLGLSHFFNKEEFTQYLKGFHIVDPCEVIYDLPLEESKRRGFNSFRQTMWNLYAIK